jgi:hypothetical protein
MRELGVPINGLLHSYLITTGVNLGLGGGGAGGFRTDAGMNAGFVAGFARDDISASKRSISDSIVFQDSPIIN